MAYNSKYTGAQVEAILDKANTGVPVDSEMSWESENPLQNKVVTRQLQLRAVRMSLEDVTDAEIAITITPNTIFSCTSAVSSLTVNTPQGGQFSDEDQQRYECIIRIAPRATPPTVTWPSSLLWPNGKIMSIEANTLYEFSIVTACGYYVITGQAYKEASV